MTSAFPQICLKIIGYSKSTPKFDYLKKIPSKMSFFFLKMAFGISRLIKEP